MTLDATIGGVNSNSYVDVTYANAYFSQRLYSENWWLAQTDAREMALITATLRLEQEQYVGGRATDAQALMWPRYWVETRDSAFVSDYLSTYYPIYYPATEIPKPVKDAECELAISLLTTEFSVNGLQLGSITSMNVGPITVSLGAGGIGLMPAQVGRLLRGFRVSSSGVPMVRA